MSSPKIFIIESLKFRDEKKQLFEGKVIARILRMSGSTPKYVYIRTRQELEKIIDQFEDSEFRYLHFSCHGNKNGIDLTLDALSFDKLGEILSPMLKKRRVFFSACEVMNEKLAALLLKNTGCYSVIGPSKLINFDRAAIFWASFYHLMLRDSARSMKRKDMKNGIQRLQSIFGVHMRYFSQSKSRVGFQEIQLE